MSDAEVDAEEAHRLDVHRKTYESSKGWLARSYLANPIKHGVKKMSVLNEAHGLVHGDRQASYGHPKDDFTRTAALASTCLEAKLKEPLSAEDVALFMVCVKLSRQVKGHKRDNLVDAAGYIETLAMLHGES